jgi:hypothetical protein
VLVAKSVVTHWVNCLRLKLQTGRGLADLAGGQLPFFGLLFAGLADGQQTVSASNRTLDLNWPGNGGEAIPISLAVGIAGASGAVWDTNPMLRIKPSGSQAAVPRGAAA